VTLAPVLRAVVGSAFVVAGAGKLLDQEEPRIAPVLLGAAPGPVAFAAALAEDALPWIELLAGVAFWSAAGTIARHFLGVSLASLFLAVALAIPEGVRCRCFGALGEFESRAGHAIVASALAAGVIALYGAERKRMKPLDLGDQRRTGVPEAT
jgi:hypothetical protein